MVVGLEVTNKVPHSVIFAPRSFKFCVVVGIEVTIKVPHPKGMWHLDGVAFFQKLSIMYFLIIKQNK